MKTFITRTSKNTSYFVDYTANAVISTKKDAVISTKKDF
jgi:hypothetical protein